MTERDVYGSDFEATVCDNCGDDLTPDEAVHCTHCSTLDCTLQCAEHRGEAADDARSDRAYDAERHG